MSIKDSKRKQPHTLQSVSDSYDYQKCTECDGRAALVTGYFCYEPDEEPYNDGIVENAKVESGECWVVGYKCDDCGNIQGLYHE